MKRRRPIRPPCPCGKPFYALGLCKSCYRRKVVPSDGKREFAPTTDYRYLLSPETLTRLEAREA